MRLAHLAALGFLLASPSTALAGSWEVRPHNEGNRAAVTNESRTITVTIFCGGDGAMISITHTKAVPWLKNQSTELMIGGEAFPLAAAREGDTFGIFNINPKTLKPAMVGALRSGVEFAITGDSTTDIDAADLRFTLDGSSRALDQIAGGCT